MGGGLLFLVVLAALVHSLTACNIELTTKIQNGCHGVPKWLIGAKNKKSDSFRWNAARSRQYFRSQQLTEPRYLPLAPQEQRGSIHTSVVQTLATIVSYTPEYTHYTSTRIQ